MRQLWIVITTFLFLSVNAATVDKKASEFKWLGTKVSGKHFGTISPEMADLKLDKKGKLTGGKIVMNLKSIDVKDIQGKWRQKLTQHLLGSDFFNIEDHPTATLEIKKVYLKTIVADLTIKGKTNKVEFPYKREGNTYTGVMTFDRTKFGMKYGSGSFFSNLGDKMIHNDVKLTYKVVVM